MSVTNEEIMAELQAIKTQLALQVKVKKPSGRMLPHAPKVANPRNVSCAYLGKETGAMSACATCKGKVELKVLECHCPSHKEHPTTTKPDCWRCPDWVKVVPAK